MTMDTEEFIRFQEICKIQNIGDLPYIYTA